MHIAHVEISNFRKLLSVRVDLADKTTLFVGANNSGKTSAMLALRRFLVTRPRHFQIHDFTLSHWTVINAIGARWLAARRDEAAPDLGITQWSAVLPTVDVWLQVEPSELHHVSKLVPTLDWEGGLLGVRLRLEPKDVEQLQKAFVAAAEAANTVRAAGNPAEGAQEGADAADATKLRLWPTDLMDFLSRRLNEHMTVRSYALDPAKLMEPTKSVAAPQVLDPLALPIEGDPLSGLIRINEISAQRGFGESAGSDGEFLSARPSGRLSEQLRSYYRKHLDPSEYPDPDDIRALQAIDAAQAAFDERLTESFKAAFTEVSGLGYPGMTDPRPRVMTKVRPIDGLDHQAAVTFEIDVVKADGEIVPIVSLPEDNNGLGYQNLISMIFRLMSFRDAWMRVGKAASPGSEPDEFEPLQLVLIEEPEAHLHAQVQQVFIKKAFDVLRAHPELGDNLTMRTQLIVSTHSGHVAHEIDYSNLRYFRRLPAGMNKVTVPTSVVVNLTKTFGGDDDTARFVRRYLRAQHADLFFADALILVEGSAERMLLPHFIRRSYPGVDQGYITLLEVGGSHAHKLRPLVEHLGLITLVITDLDAQDEVMKTDKSGKERKTNVAAQPKIGAALTTNNDTLKTWLPSLSDIDALLAGTVVKILASDEMHEVRVAYQTAVAVTLGGTEQTAHPYTFEDALAFENIEFFRTLPGSGLVRQFREGIAGSDDVAVIGAELFAALRETGDKAAFALTVLGAENFESLKVPGYIADGLAWLETQLQKRQVHLLSTTAEGTNG